MLSLLLAAVLSTPVGVQDIQVDRGEYIIHAEAMGKGTPIVAIAGGPGFSGRAVWSFGYDMQDVAQVILFDQLGTGKSRLISDSKTPADHTSLEKTIADLEAIRKQMGLKKWSVFGQSWGAVVAVSYAARHPEAVDRLIIASTPGFSSFEQHILTDNLTRAIPEAEQDQIAAVMQDESLTEDQKFERAILMQLPYYFFHAYEGKALAARAPDGLFTPSVFKALYPAIHDSKTYELIEKGIKRWKGQALIIQGHNDPCGGAMGFLLKERFLPRAEVEMMSDGGHFTWLERANRTGFFWNLRDWMNLPLKPYMTDDFEVYQKGEDEAWKKSLEDGWPFNFKPVAPRT